VFENTVQNLVGVARSSAGLKKTRKHAAAPSAYRIQLSLWDSSGIQFENLRTLQYSGSSTVLVVFSVVDRESFRSALSTWIPEVRHQGDKEKEKPIILVGLDEHLRTDPDALRKLSAAAKREHLPPVPVSREEAELEVRSFV
jgi:GTPase SAR1 family protein